MKTNYDNLIRISFLIVLVYFFSLFQKCTKYKVQDILLQRWTNFYEYPADHYKTYILGASHAGFGINATMLGHLIQSETLNLFSRGENIEETYYSLKEIYQKDQPNNVVIEVFSLGLNSNEGLKLNPPQHGYDKLRFGVNKLDYVINTVPYGQWLDYLTPVFREHLFWSKTSNWIDAMNALYMSKDSLADGTRRGSSQLAKSHFLNVPVQNSKEINQLEFEYLKKIKSLTDENGSRLILTIVPIVPAQYKQENMRSFIRSLELFCIQNSIEFIDVNQLLETNFDQRFYLEQNRPSLNQHLNVIGATAVTEELALKIVSRSSTTTNARFPGNDPNWHGKYLRTFYTLPSFLDNISVNNRILISTRDKNQSHKLIKLRGKFYGHRFWDSLDSLNQEKINLYIDMSSKWSHYTRAWKIQGADSLLFLTNNVEELDSIGFKHIESDRVGSTTYFQVYDASSKKWVDSFTTNLAQKSLKLERLIDVQ